MDTRMAQAQVRFGLGRRGDETFPADPRGWLLAQLRGPHPARFDTLPDSAACLAAIMADRRDRKAARVAQEKPPPSRAHRIFVADAAAQTYWALATDAPFRERLVWFWANHFTVSRRQGVCIALCGAFVREAIRPHVTGRFVDMLLAVMRHPAMLLYLSNATSVGPDSPIGQRRHRGLNENLARECLELHTVSPASGYTQADVTAFAAVLTGWSIAPGGDDPGFLFRAKAHEPGTQTIMGHRFPAGEEGGVAVLRFLAGHPATHTHLATKLVRHFVADAPPPDAVARIAAVLRDSQGDLAAAAAALVDLPQAWQPMTKLRTPQDYVAAALRALDLPRQRQHAVGAMAALGQPLWAAPMPNGWPDTAADWAGSDALLRRIDWSYGLSAHVGNADALQIAEASLGPLLHADTLQRIRRAGSRRDALTLLLSSPEFQRR